MSKNVTDDFPMARPVCRADCKGASRPCPWVSCRYHLYLDINEGTGTIKFKFPELEIWELEHTCALDLAEARDLTYEEVGQALNLTRERIRQLTNEVLTTLYERLFPDEERFAMLPFPGTDCAERD
jgi:hypothetical protein